MGSSESLIDTFIYGLFSAGAIKTGEFKLKNGKTSDVFVDFGEVYSGKEVSLIADCFARKIRQDIGFDSFDIIMGPPYKGIVLASAITVSLMLQNHVDKMYSAYRKEEKDHGEGGLFFGCKPKDGDRILIVDDVISDGAAKAETIRIVKSFADVEISGILVGVDRRNSMTDTRTICIDEWYYNTWSIITLDDIRNVSLTIG